MTTPLHLSDADVRSFGEGEVLIRDGMLPAGALVDCSGQMARLDADGRFTRARTGESRRQSSARDDRTAWADDVAGPLRDLLQLFETVRLELNEQVWLGVATFTTQLSVYGADGARYAAHRDAIAGDPARRATAILYLNPDWHASHGGCLRIHPPSGSRDVEPLGGRLVIFRSDRLLHEVLPSYQVRHAATAWFRGRASNPARNAAQD